MKKTTLVMSFLLVFSLFCFISATRASASNKIMVGVFYYPWYYGGNQTGHWNGNPKNYNINLTETWWTVVDPPLLSWYASDNTTVIDQHLDWFKYAGIDFGILSWWGPNSSNKTMQLVFNETCIKTIFDETEHYESRTNYTFKWVISVEDCNESGAQRYIQDYIYTEYANPSAYGNIWLDNASNGKPFLFWFNGKMTNSSSDREAIYNDTRFSAKILDQVKDFADWNTWTPYTADEATSAFPPKNGFMCVMPRYDETRLDPNGTMGVVRDQCADLYLNGSYRNHTDPLNEPLYDYQWKEVLSNASAGKVQYVGIATWNDFTERTQIEPCYDNTSAYKDDPFFLLNKTKYYISILKDSEAPTISMLSQVPSENVTEDQNVTISANATDYGSGVNRVLLNWTTNVTPGMASVSMIFNSETRFYEGVILGQKAGTSVNYSITAYDNANNCRVDDNQTYYYNYVVTPEFSPLLVFPLFMLATLAAVIVYKRKETHSAQRQNLAGQ